MQIGGAAGRARIAAPVAIRAVAELAVGLVVEQPVPEGNILGLRRANCTGRAQHDGNDNAGAGTSTSHNSPTA